MKNVFDYFFYRIALFYKKRMPLEDYIHQGHAIIIIALAFYFMSFLDIVLFYLGYDLSIPIIVALYIPFGIIVFFSERFFPESEKLLDELKCKYKNERLFWLKGLAVFFFLVFSLVLYIWTLFHFKIPQ